MLGRAIVLLGPFLLTLFGWIIRPDIWNHPLLPFDSVWSVMVSDGLSIPFVGQHILTLASEYLDLSINARRLLGLLVLSVGNVLLFEAIRRWCNDIRVAIASSALVAFHPLLIVYVIHLSGFEWAVVGVGLCLLSMHSRVGLSAVAGILFPPCVTLIPAMILFRGWKASGGLLVGGSLGLVATGRVFETHTPSIELWQAALVPGVEAWTVALAFAVYLMWREGRSDKSKSFLGLVITGLLLVLALPAWPESDDLGPGVVLGIVLLAVLPLLASKLLQTRLAFTGAMAFILSNSLAGIHQFSHVYADRSWDLHISGVRELKRAHKEGDDCRVLTSFPSILKYHTQCQMALTGKVDFVLISLKKDELTNRPRDSVSISKSTRYFPGFGTHLIECKDGETLTGTVGGEPFRVTC